MPELINDKPLDIEPAPTEPAVSLAEEAPTLTKDAGIPEAQLQADLCPAQEPVQAPAPAIPAHHLQACYKWLRGGSSIESASRNAGVPEETARIIAEEISAVCMKLGSEAPAHCKPVAVEVVVDEPVKPEKVIG